MNRRHRPDDSTPVEPDPLVFNVSDITERVVAPNDFATREVSDRIRGAVERITVPVGGRVLEIGCGDGQAAALVCEAIGEHGTMLAIDRSPVMIAATGERNDVHVLSKRLKVRAARAQRASLEPASFDLVFGINVRNMWDDPATSKALRAALAPEGRLWAVLQLPPTKDATGLDATIAARLEKAGFHVEQAGLFEPHQTPGCWVECSVRD